MEGRRAHCNDARLGQPSKRVENLLWLRPEGAIGFRDVRTVLQLSFWAADGSPVLAAFLDVVRANCAEVGSRLDDVLAKHPAVRQIATSSQEGRAERSDEGA
jgi:hypothetical protein